MLFVEIKRIGLHAPDQVRMGRPKRYEINAPGLLNARKYWGVMPKKMCNCLLRLLGRPPNLAWLYEFRRLVLWANFFMSKPVRIRMHGSDKRETCLFVIMVKHPRIPIVTFYEKHGRQESPNLGKNCKWNGLYWHYLGYKNLLAAAEAIEEATPSDSSNWQRHSKEEQPWRGGYGEPYQATMEDLAPGLPSMGPQELQAVRYDQLRWRSIWFLTLIQWWCGSFKVEGMMKERATPYSVKDIVPNLLP